MVQMERSGGTCYFSPFPPPLFYPGFYPASMISTLVSTAASYLPSLSLSDPFTISECKRHRVTLCSEAVNYTIALKLQTSPHSRLTRPCVVCIFISHPTHFPSSNPPATHTAFTHAHMSASYSAASARRTHFSTCTISAILLPLPGAPASPTFQLVLITSTFPSASPP